jgi:hypothetical protein
MNLKDGKEEVLEGLTCLKGLMQVKRKPDPGLKLGTLTLSTSITKLKCLQKCRKCTYCRWFIFYHSTRLYIKDKMKNIYGLRYQSFQNAWSSKYIVLNFYFLKIIIPLHVLYVNDLAETCRISQNCAAYFVYSKKLCQWWQKVSL